MLNTKRRAQKHGLRFVQDSTLYNSAKHVHILFFIYKNIFLLFQAKDKEVRGTKFVVTGLKENALFKFRVLALNAAGLSEPGEVADALEMKDRISKSQ